MPGWIPQCGVPEITVSPDECSCEDSSKVYWPLQCQIQGAILYGKVVYHLDARYVATQYQYLKQSVVLNRNETIMGLHIDDKAVVPVGDPGMLLSTGVRPHNRVRCNRRP